MWEKHRSKWSMRLGSWCSRPLFWTGHPKFFRNKSSHFKVHKSRPKHEKQKKLIHQYTSHTSPPPRPWKDSFSKFQQHPPQFGIFPDWLILGFSSQDGPYLDKHKHGQSPLILRNPITFTVYGIMYKSETRDPFLVFSPKTPCLCNFAFWFQLFSRKRRLKPPLIYSLLLI